MGYDPEDSDHNKLLLENFVDKTSTLIEAIKRNIANEGVLDDKTVLALNELITAANQMQDIMDYLQANSGRTLN